jgi:hypothetical protein
MLPKEVLYREDHKVVPLFTNKKLRVICDFLKKVSEISNFKKKIEFEFEFEIEKLRKIKKIYFKKKSQSQY